MRFLLGSFKKQACSSVSGNIGCRPGVIVRTQCLIYNGEKEIAAPCSFNDMRFILQLSHRHF